jgi:hypothetical protein
MRLTRACANNRAGDARTREADSGPPTLHLMKLRRFICGQSISSKNRPEFGAPVKFAAPA